MQFNLFSWIREGVRRSVLMGVTDAVDAIGEPVGSEGKKDRLSKLIEFTPQPAGSTAGSTATINSAGGKRKRLGRSLKDFSPGESSK